MYPTVQLLIDGNWGPSQSGKTLDVLNPATGEVNGTVAHADIPDLDRALAAAQKGFETWRRMSAYDRSKIMRKAAETLRTRVDEIARIMTLEQGKPFGEAKIETAFSADIIEWFAEEARRAYGRVVPSRAENVMQLVIKEPVGPVAAFTPWNFPINQANRKICGALAAGCSIIVKGPEETPGSLAAYAQCWLDAGLPAGVINLVFGVPATISEYLIPHPIIKKISFTGSTPVGKHLAALAGAHMKRVTMELGGHAPSMVFDDANIDTAATILGTNKFRNAGQVCVAPTRFLVQDAVHDEFVEKLVAHAKKIKVGNGLEQGTTMGPLANARRIPAMETLINDAVAKGATIAAGGKRIGNVGNFFEPTVLTGMTTDMRAMNEEPFGPLALVGRFSTIDEVIAEANRLDYGLAAYAYTSSQKTLQTLTSRVEVGMLSVNHHGIALPEVPFGGVKDSGYGSEGGTEAIEAYLNTKMVSAAAL
ncbi:NAD-dependent succinate-semialdehyde dehydrogenase [Aliidongia dinghuensis]|uniref:NAD-dependent succinate-semialdehyde dehydrogenase n=1 Tax=Aliidongia dinghuensis TaxID=1867774 RepID=A0A8J3E6F5_9PROT|nr:NAD-dependent succinate-semialdehyde dehydrogenase [Aliidongia dinghuensis]GGF44086.1 NAD-dependent succinate-semialdehyde dehydrogenase [Aliidongia dinghuensis]